MVGSGIRDPEKTYSGSRIQGSKRHRIPDPGSGSATLDFGDFVLIWIKLFQQRATSDEASAAPAGKAGENGIGKGAYQYLMAF